MFDSFKTCILLHLCCFTGFITSLPKKKSLVIDFMSDNNFIHTKKEINCESDLYKLYCRTKCQEKRNSLGICLEGNCFCVIDDEPELLPHAKPKKPISMKAKYKNILNKHTQEKPLYLPLDLLKKPMLRHQIAHFCPNLDIARKCIRKCVAQGKPGFCGKDHVCYCGHKYLDTKFPDDPKILAKYKNFRDMYEAFFPDFYKKHNTSEIEKDYKDNTLLTGDKYDRGDKYDKGNADVEQDKSESNEPIPPPQKSDEDDTVIEDVPDTE